MTKKNTVPESLIAMCFLSTIILFGCETTQPQTEPTTTPTKPEEVVSRSSRRAVPGFVSVLAISSGELSKRNASVLIRTLEQAKAEGTDLIVVDLSGVHSIDASGLRFLDKASSLFGSQYFAIANAEDKSADYLSIQTKKYQIFASTQMAIDALQAAWTGRIPSTIASSDSNDVVTTASVGPSATQSNPRTPGIIEKPSKYTTPNTVRGDKVPPQNNAQTAAKNSIDLERRAEAERERKRLKAQAKTISEANIIGTVLGTLAGTALSDDKVGGALRGAAIGSAVGSLAGSYVAAKQAEYGDKLDLLDAMILDVQNAQKQLIADIELLDRFIAQKRVELEKLSLALRDGKIKRKKYQQQLSNLKADQERAQVIADGSREELKKFKEAGKVYRKKHQKVSTDRYDAKVDEMSILVNQLDAKVDELESLGNTL